MDFDEQNDEDLDLQELSPLMQALVPKISACRIREYDAEDLEACVEILRSNESGDEDRSILDSFIAFLKGGTSYFLVVEHGGDVIGCGGLEMVGDPDSATLMHSMIHMEYQRRGFGSALLAAQLSLLEAEDRPVELWTAATEDNAGFYERFGFEAQSDLLASTAGSLQMSLNLMAEDIEDARNALIERSVQLILNAEEEDEEEEPESYSEETEEEL